MNIAMEGHTNFTGSTPLRMACLSGGILGQDIEFVGGIKEGFQQLVEFRDSYKKLVAAKAFANHYFGLVPHYYSLDELVSCIVEALAPTQAETTAIKSHVRKLYQERSRLYTRTVALNLPADYADLHAGIDAFIKAYDPGVKWLLVIRSPHGTGKNQVGLRRILDELTGKLIDINHRRSLCADSATQFGMEHYMARTIAPGKPLVCCINSIVNPELEDCLHGGKIIFIDEAAQVMDELGNRYGTIARHGKSVEVINKLAELMGRADIVVLADADLSDWDVAQYRLLAPSRKLFVINQPFTDQGRVIRHGTYSQARRKLKQAINEGRKCLIVSDSVDYLIVLARQIEKWLRKEGITGRVQLVNSKDGHQTVNDPRVVELLSDINQHVVKYHALLSSPTLASGVSLTVPHFDEHFFFYRGTVTPAAFNQMMLRDRTWKACYLGLYGMYKPRVSTGDLIGIEVGAERYRAEVTGEEYTYDPKAELPLLRNQRDARHSLVLSNPPQSILMLFDSRCYKLEKLYSQNCGDSLAEFRRLNQLEFRELVRSVGAVSDLDARDIEKTLTKTREDSLKLISYKMHACLNLKPYAYLEDIHFDVWDDGRLERQKRRLRKLYGGDKEPIRQAALKLLAHAGIDLETGEGVVTAESAAYAWKLMNKNDAGKALMKEKLLPFLRKVPDQPIRWLGVFLDKFYLKLEGEQCRQGEDRGERVYRLDKERKALCEGWLNGEPLVDLTAGDGKVVSGDF